LEDDLKLINAFKAGDKKAFEKIVKKYQNRVASLVYLVLGKNIDNEDIVQEVFLRVYHSLMRYEPKVSFYSWLYRIVINICIDEIRRKKIRKIITFDFLTDNIYGSIHGEESESPVDVILAKEKKDIIQSALQRISPSYRIVLILREYNDMDYKEIANVLNLSVEAVKSRIFRARQEMRKLLQKYFE